jgi:hypothetical protein
MKKHNFNAGPSILPRIAVENSAKAILDLNGIGLSLLEISAKIFRLFWMKPFHCLMTCLIFRQDIRLFSSEVVRVCSFV